MTFLPKPFYPALLAGLLLSLGANANTELEQQVPRVPPR